MNYEELAAKVQMLRPGANAGDVARLCLLMCNAVEDLSDLEDESKLASVWQEVGLRLQAATDQHAAMTEELEHLAQSDPVTFSPEQIWTLIRAIKVQSQVLELYLGEPVLGN